MSITLADKRTTFRKLYEAVCFVLPNPFDVGSALALQHLGVKALASTSAGFAWTHTRSMSIEDSSAWAGLLFLDIRSAVMLLPAN